MAKADLQDVQQKIDALNASVRKASLRGAWQRQSAAQDDIQPWVWRWKDMLPNILEAGNLIPIDDTMKMRTIHMVNPSQGLPLGTTRTFAAMLQHLNPGEVTQSHRHTASSVYFMIQGSGLYTTAEGEQQWMEPGDLLTQPNWTWHGSTNSGSAPAIWFTAMDSPLTQYLSTWSVENYPDGRTQPITKPDGYHLKRMGALRCSTVLQGSPPFPVRFPWKDTFNLLQELAASGECDPFDGVVLDYTEPLTGGPTTATIGCRIQMLRPGEQTHSHRHTCSTVYYVVQGTGVTRLGKDRRDEKNLDWSEHDCFSVPPWYWHQFRNESSALPAILFSTSDRPLLKAMRLYREENEH